MTVATYINFHEHSHLIQDGLTALHLASVRGHVAVVRLLIQAHAVIDLQSKVKITK